MMQAEEGIKELEKHVDSLIVIPNEIIPNTNKRLENCLFRFLVSLLPKSSLEWIPAPTQSPEKSDIKIFIIGEAIPIAAWDSIGVEENHPKII